MSTAAYLIDDAHEWVAKYHPYSSHLVRTLDWLEILASDASGPVRLAALLHDIERATPDLDSPFDAACDWHRDAYVDYHQGRCAAHLTAWMTGRGATQEETVATVAIVAVHERGGWPDADLVQAADSLSFIETMVPVFVEWVATGRSSAQSARAKLDHMWHRIRVPEARDLGRALYETTRGKLPGVITDW